MIFDSLTFPLTHCIPGDIFRCRPSCHGVWRDAMVQHLLQQKDGHLPLIRLPDPTTPENIDKPTWEWLVLYTQLGKNMPPHSI